MSFLNQMTFLNGIVAEFRERKLWPLAVVLLAALVGIPVLLSKSAHSTPVSPGPTSALPISARGALASVTVNNSPSHSRLGGSSRDPFTQQKMPAPVTATASNPVGSSAVGSSATGLNASALTNSLPASNTGSSSGASSSSGSASQPAPLSTIPGTSIPTTPPPPPHNGLTATESYHVTLGITNASGGLDTIDPLERLSVLPSNQQPLLVELGVLKGGHRVLFAVQPGTVVQGPGQCTPGPVDCEILSLAQDQVEQLGVASQNGAVPVGLFAVTGITIDHHPSAAAAHKARLKASAAGRRLLSQSTSGALALFQYKPSLGAVVDLRDLSVGG